MKKPKCKIYPDGTKEWHLNGKPHRDDGPATECANGIKYWYLNGERHREDGPAVVLVNGEKFWYLNGKHYCASYWPPLRFAKGFVLWIEAVKELQGKK